MEILEKIKYHKTLANYFAGKSLYLDEIACEKPNIRKVAEQPWQQIEGGLKTNVIETLCGLLFIDAKVKAGMLRQLKSDFEKALEIRKDKRIKITDYKTDASLLNSLTNLNDSERETPPEKPLYKPGEIIGTNFFIDDPKSTDKIKRISNAEAGDTNEIEARNESTSLQSFYVFITTQGHLLERMPGETLAIAYNYSKLGVVAQQSRDLLKKTKKPWISNHPRPATATIFPLCRFVFKMPKGYATSIALAKESNKLISGGLDGSITIWNIDTGSHLSTLTGHLDIINAVAISNNAEIAISAGRDKTLKVWDIPLNKCIHTLTGHTESISSVTMSANGNIAASVSDDKTIRIWNLKSGICIKVIEEISGFNSIALVSEGRMAYTCNKDETIRAWDTQSGKCLRIMRGHGYKFLVEGFEEKEYFRGPQTPAINIDYAQQGKIAITCSYDFSVRIWDMISGKCLRVLEYENQDIALEPVYGHDTDISITPDGRIAVASRENNILQVWDVVSGTKLRTLEGHSGKVTCVKITSDGETAISSSEDGTIRIWNIISGIKTIPILSKGRKKFNYTYDCHCLTQNEKIDIYVESKYANPSWRLRSLSDDHWDPEINKTNINIRDAISKKVLRILNSNFQIFKIIPSPDNRYLVSMNRGENDSVQILIWDITYGICIKKSCFQRGSWLIGETPDGKSLILDINDLTIQVINYFSGECSCIITKKENLLSASISPDGRYLVSASEKGQIFLWEISTGECIHSFHGHSETITDIVFSPDAKKIISAGGRDETLRIWDLSTGECIASYSPGTPVYIRSQMTPDGHIEYGWEDQTRLFTLNNISLGSPVVTPFRYFNYHLEESNNELQNESAIMHYKGEAIPGKYDETISFKCPWCHIQFALPDLIDKTIYRIQHEYQIAQEDAPCLKLPAEAWYEPGLESVCPGCRKPLKFNPFIVDNQSKCHYDGRIDEFGKAVRLLKERSSGNNESMKINFGVGCLCRKLNLIEEAIYYFEIVIRQWENHKQSQLKKGLHPEKEYSGTAAGAHNELAFFKFVPLKDWYNAEKYYSEAIKLFEHCDNFVESMNSQLNLHLMFYLSGKPVNKQRLTELIKILEEKGDKRAAKGKELLNKIKEDTEHC